MTRTTMTEREQQPVGKPAKRAAPARPRPRAGKADDTAAVLAKIAAMPAPCTLHEPAKAKLSAIVGMAAI